MDSGKGFGFWRWYLRSRAVVPACFFGFGGIFAAVFALYALPLEAVLYPGLLCLGLGAAALGLDGAMQYRRHRQRVLLLNSREADPGLLPEPRTLAEAELGQLSCLLHQQIRAQRTAQRTREQETLDYFAVWVHQIKTPIAAMGMLLQEEDRAENRKISAELFRIEQYVDMVLGYLRLQSEDSDYVFRETPLDPVIRGSIRKFAPQFVQKRIRLEYEGTEETAFTDEKWLRFILEQLLSNAIKYTPRGRIAIQVRGGVIAVEDTGIGIAPEDLPRIFERGFTGYNGRAEQKATGLGLYLCRQAARRLGVGLEVFSQVGEGTKVRLSLKQTRLDVE